MKLPIRFFGFGLLTAALIFLISIYFFTDTEVDLDEVSLEDLSNYLESEGYHIITQEQYISLAVKEREEQKLKNEEENSSAQDDINEEADDNKEKEKDKDSKKNEEADKKKESEKTKDTAKEDSKKESKTVHKYTLTVKPNMLGPDVSELLEKNKIIKNAADFTKYLEDNNYSRFIQLGDHKLTSEMSHYEIAETITSN